MGSAQGAPLPEIAAIAAGNTNAALEVQMTSARQSMLDRIDRAAERSQTYTTVVVFGGYAAILTIWGYTKDLLHPWDAYWSAATLIISLLFFVSFEVFKVVVNGSHLLEFSVFLKTAYSPSDFFKEHQKLLTKHVAFEQNILRPFWIVILLLTIIPALAAAIILVKACLGGLLTGAL